VIGPFLGRYHVISLDQRGHGASEWPTPPAYATEDFVSDLLGGMEERRLDASAWRRSALTSGAFEEVAFADLASGRTRFRLTLPATPPEVWGAGVTYRRSADFRKEGSGIYDRVYVADRPELFFKASAWRVRGPRAAGRSLQVDAILSGTIQRSGDQIRATVQLVHVASGRTIWSGKFDQTFTDIFGIQDSISDSVVRSLALNLTADEQKQLGKHYTTNVAAYDSYLMGLYFWNKRSKEGLGKAIDYFQTHAAAVES